MAINSIRRELSDNGRMTVEVTTLTTKRKDQAFTVLMQDPDFQTMLTRYTNEPEGITNMHIWEIKHSGIGSPAWHISYDLPIPGTTRHWSGVFSFYVPWLGSNRDLDKGYCAECGSTVFNHADSCWSCKTKFK